MDVFGRDVPGRWSLPGARARCCGTTSSARHRSDSSPALASSADAYACALRACGRLFHPGPSKSHALIPGLAPQPHGTDMQEWQRRFKLAPGNGSSQVPHYESITTAQGRAKTFYSEFWRNNVSGATYLIDSGFFATSGRSGQADDQVMCAFCGMELAGWPAIESQHQVDLIHWEMSERKCPYLINEHASPNKSLRKNMELEFRDARPPAPTSVSVLKTVLPQGNGYVCDLSFSPQPAQASPSMHTHGTQVSFNMNHDHRNHQFASVVVQHENPSQRDFTTAIVTGCNGSGFVGDSSELSHTICLTDMPRLNVVRVKDCSHCKVVIQLGQSSQKLRVDMDSCGCVELAFEVPQGQQVVVTEPDVQITQSVCCLIDLPAMPISFQLNAHGSACISLRADGGDAIAVPDKTVTRVINGEIVTKCHMD